MESTLESQQTAESPEDTGVTVEAGEGRRSRRVRPLGLTIAIVSAALTYGVLPMLPVLLVLWTQFTGRQIGMDLVNTPGNWISIGLGAGTLVASILAWVGRPTGVRLLLVLLVWISTGLAVYRMVQPIIAPEPSGEVLGGTLSNPTMSLLCMGGFMIAIALYVTWYLNRAPARAFYRRP